MSMKLDINVLGSPQVHLNNQPVVDFITSKAQALFTYLAITEREHTRDSVAFLLWPDISNRRARRNLTDVTTNLRKLLSPYLIITPQTIAFNLQNPYQLDVAQFESILTRPHAQVERQVLKDALDLYKGDFLEGFSVRNAAPFEEWASERREWYRGLLTRGLHHLAEECIEHGEYAQGLYATRRLLALDRWNELAYQQQMSLLAYSGQRTMALAQYGKCRGILIEEFGSEPSAQTQALYEQIRTGAFYRESQQLLHNTNLDLLAVTPERLEIAHIDWGEMPTPTTFTGREDELAVLHKWVIQDRCRLVSILGMGGQGKTALAATFSHNLAGDDLAENALDHSEGHARLSPPANNFEQIIWRSLLNAPPLVDILNVWIHFLSDHRIAALPGSTDKQINLLLDYLQQKRSLLILDNVESILESGERTGYYRQGYEQYGRLFQRIGESQHKSCLLLTSRERPIDLARLERQTATVRAIELPGLQEDDCILMLRRLGLSAEKHVKTELINRYSGNPLAIKLITDTIKGLFGGDIETFLSQETLIFDDIRDVLDQQFSRLSPLQQEILIWLTIEREPLPFHELWKDLAFPQSQRAFAEAMRSLQRRFLIESFEEGIGLQHVVMEYITDYFFTAVCDELETGALHFFNTHALLKAESKAYVRESQHRLVLQPIADFLVSRWGKAGAGEHLHRLLDTMRAQNLLASGYAAGNILDLLLNLEVDLHGFDFSRITVRQADMRRVALPGVDFSYADLTQSVFIDAFGAICSIAFSPDGQILAVGTFDGEIRLWRLRDLQPFGSFKAHSNPIFSIAFSPTGTMLASGSGDHTVRLWALATESTTGPIHHQLRNTLHGHTNWVWSVAFSPDGELLASGGDDQTIHLWHAHTGQIVHVLQGHAHWIWSVAFSPDGLTLASSDQHIYLWDVASGQLIQTYPENATQQGADFIFSIAFSPDGAMLASGSSDHNVRLWDVESGQLRHTLIGHNSFVRTVDFRPDGKLLATGGNDQFVRLWDVSSGMAQRILKGHGNSIWAVTFSPDNTTLASGGADQLVCLWNTEAGRLRQSLHGHTSFVLSIDFHPNGTTLASGNSNRLVNLWQIDTGKLQRSLGGHTNWVLAVAYSPDGRYLATSGDDQTVRLWDAETGQLLHALLGHTGQVWSIAFSPDGAMLASGSDDQTIRLWDVRTAQLRRTLRGHMGQVWSVDFCPEGNFLASSGSDQTVRLWDLQELQSAAGDTPHILLGHDKWVLTVAFSPDGTRLASAGADHKIYLWDRVTGQPTACLVSHNNWIWSLAFSPDGKWLATGSADQTVCIWEVSTGALRQTLYGHEGYVWCVKFSPDGRLLASSSGDETIRLWDRETGTELQDLHLTGPYTGMNITGVTGITETQRNALKLLGAYENQATYS